MTVTPRTQAQFAANSLQQFESRLSKSLTRLSLGTRLVSPADDPSGLAASARLDSHLQRLNAALSNVTDALSFSQTRDGYLGKMSKALDRMGELAALAQDSTKSESDRASYQREFQELAAFISSLATKEFNGIKLFNGQSIKSQIDVDGAPFVLEGVDLSAAVYNDTFAASISNPSAAADASAHVQAAIAQLGLDRGMVGSHLSRLHLIHEQLVLNRENLTAANSKIKDVDVAAESTQFARYNILMQSSTSLLAQANSLRATALLLLQ